MQAVSHQGLSFSGLAWIFESLSSKHSETSIWCHRKIKDTLFIFSKCVITVIYCIQLLYVL